MFDFKTFPTDDLETKLRISSTFLFIYNSCGQNALIALCPVEDVKNKISQTLNTIKV